MSDRVGAVICWLAGMMIIVSVLMMGGCQTSRPKVNVDVWAGDSKENGITRAQAHSLIKCADIAFNEYACMSYRDLSQLMELLSRCKEW